MLEVEFLFPKLEVWKNKMSVIPGGIIPDKL